MVSVENLASKWMINLDTTKYVIDSATQLVIRSSNNPSLFRRFKANDCILWYNHVTSDVFVYTLCSENTSKSKRQFICAQLFVTEFGYTHILPMKCKGYVQHFMKNFFKNFGVTPAIITDFSGEQVQGGVWRICEQVGFHIRNILKIMPWANRAE